MISYIEKGAGLNFKGRPKIKVSKRGTTFPVKARFGKHGTLHLDNDAALALYVELRAALAPAVKRGAA